uniref:Uncharacterized protein n=1 Tax=Tanacetum cinerariifolium TaxID=118510 RepID=A0A699J3E1_TANCI|nr:hypothetical protein [Tanacetum cinerariifolium]
MANLYHYGSDAVVDVHNPDNVDTNMINHVVQAMPSSEHSNVVNHSETKITSDSNIISYSQYRAQHLEPKLYDGNVIEKTSAIMIHDFEETLMLVEEGRSKMFLKQKDPIIPAIVEVPKELPKSLGKSFGNYDSQGALRKLKGKALADDVVTSYSIDPEILNVDAEPLNPRLLNNRSAHSDYLKQTQEEDAILREIVEQGKSKNPLNAYLDSACKYTKQIQELLIIIGQTCPSFNNSREKLVAVTPKNKDKRVIFTEPVTPSGNTITNNASSSNLVSNKPVLSSTGVRSSIRASGSQPLGNTKKAKIQLRPIRPIGRTFTIVGNACPLTRITTTIEVPSRNPIVVETDTPKPVVTLVYSRKPRKSKSTDPVSKSKVIKSVPVNKKEPSKS